MLKRANASTEAQRSAVRLEQGTRMREQDCGTRWLKEALEEHHAGEHAATLALSDGSTLVLDPSATIEPLESSATPVLLKQSRGTVLYDIKPGGPRRWTIECGVASVEVIGTSFRVERTETALRVEVIRGTVLVRGDRVPDRVAQLTAGMKLEVADPARPLPATAQPPAAEPSGVLPSPAPLAMPTESPRVETARWRELARRGENEAAYAELGSTEVARAARSASVDDLFALADLARLSGHPAEATVPLERILLQHLDDPRASLAAFTLGRVRLDSLNAPAAAARAFEKAIALGLPGGLAEDAYAHLIEARAKAGDLAGAKAALGEYVKRYSNSSPRNDFDARGRSFAGTPSIRAASMRRASLRSATASRPEASSKSQEGSGGSLGPRRRVPAGVVRRATSRSRAAAPAAPHARCARGYNDDPRGRRHPT